MRFSRARGPASARTYPPKRRTPKSDLDLAIVLHALSARDGARAVSALAKARISHPLITHVRTIFEARSKIIWLTRMRTGPNASLMHSILKTSISAGPGSSS